MASSDKTIAVTGAGGFVGRCLIPTLLESGYTVHAIVRDPGDAVAGAENHILPSYSSTRLPQILSECDTLIHLAWATTPASSQGQPLLEIEGNLLPSLQLLDYLQHSPVSRIIFISSGGAVTQMRDEPLIPEGTASAHSYYGASKAALEQYLLAFNAQFDRSVIMLRPTNLYGPGQPMTPGFGLVPTLLNALLNDCPLTIWGDGSVRKDFLFIDDFVSLLCRVIAAGEDGSKPAIVEIGGGKTYSVNEVIKLMETIAGTSIRRTYAPSRAIDPPSVEPNLVPVAQWMHWKPETTLHSGLTATYQWAKNTYASR